MLVDSPPRSGPTEPDRANEIRRLDGELAALGDRIREHDRSMPRPAQHGSTDRAPFERWNEERAALIAARRAVHRRLADRWAPLPPAAPFAGPSLFDAHWLLPFEDAYTRPVFVDRFFEHPGETGRFLRTLLLYDRVFLPTVGLLVVPLLLRMLGADRLLEALATGAVTLIRYRGALAYSADGVGLSVQQERRHLDGRPNRAAMAAWAPADAVLAALGEQFANEDDAQRAQWSAISAAVFTTLVEVDAREFDPVFQATYHDVLGHAEIAEAFGVHGERLRSLPDVPTGQVRWPAADWIGDGVDGLLHLAQSNVETYLAERVGAADQTLGPGAQTVLRARLAHAAGPMSQPRTLQPAAEDTAAAVRILELQAVSDFAAAHGDDRLVQATWQLRASPEGEAFRRWFHAHVRTAPDAAEAQLVETLVRPTVGDGGRRLPLRYLIADGASESLTPDGLLLGRFVRPGAPKILLDGVRGVLPTPGTPQTLGYRERRSRAALRRRS